MVEFKMPDTETGWMEIESVPKDGTYVLLWQEGSEPNHYVACWDDDWWMLCDGKEPWIPLRGEEPSYWHPLTKPKTL